MENSSPRKPGLPGLPAKSCRISGDTGCAASRFAGSAIFLESLCEQSDISRESIMIRKT